MSDYGFTGEGAQKQHSEQEARSEADERGTLTLSANDFSALEQRILRAVEVVRKERQGRAAAEERADRAEAQLREQSPQLEQMERDLNALRAEREHVRERVERLLGQLDALEL
jgi:chromosome segregation ATPase